MKSGLEIAQEAVLRPIADVAADAGIEPDELKPYGSTRAKVSLSILDRLADRPDGKLVITTAITPTKAGEGKTTTSVSLTQGLGAIGKRVVLALREPSMGPVFGIKGGGTGGGYAQVVPMEEINLHFNGDFHAITAAHNLLSAALDASIYHGNPLGIDPLSITWPRTLDVNDRELRNTVIGLGGKAHGVPRQEGFVITAASEIMAILALAGDLQDLRARLGRIIVASTAAGVPVTAEDLRVAGAMTVIMRDAIEPNLVQTLEHQPTLLHAGPFGNIAHANNSIIEDRVALKLADYVVTEAGFASDLGFQKFCDIVCRFGGFAPSAGVLVTTVRATKSHGGMPFADLANEDLDALRRGVDNLAAHVRHPARVRPAVRGLDQQLPDRHGRRDRADPRARGRRRRRDRRREPRVRPGGPGSDRACRGGGDGVRAPQHVPPAHARRAPRCETRSRRSPRSSTAPTGSTTSPRRRRTSPGWTSWGSAPFRSAWPRPTSR